MEHSSTSLSFVVMINMANVCHVCVNTARSRYPDIWSNVTLDVKIFFCEGVFQV